MNFLLSIFKLGTVSLTKIILLAVFLLVVIATGAFAAFNFMESKDKLVEVNTESALGIAVTYSEIFDGDSVEADLKNRRKNEHYNTWKAVADSVLKKNDLKYLYVMNVFYSDSIEYYISAEDFMGQINFLDKDVISEFDTEMISKLKNGEESKMSSISYTPKYGWIVSSYAPIKNSEGKVVAFVGADKDMTNMDNDIKKIGLKIMIASFLFLMVVFLIAMFIVRKIFIFPIRRIVEAADNFNLLNISFKNLDFTYIKEYDALIDSFRRMEKKINNAVKKSFTDDLTKLNNRYFFTLSLENILKQQEQKKKIAFGIIDLDYFKHINDTYGHDKGDFVLRSTGAILKDLFGEMPGVVARLGGDEFAFCVEVENEEVVEKKCEELKNRLALIKCSETEGGASASVGVAIASFSADAPMYSEIFNLADSTLYKVKARGRNGWEISSL